MELSLVRDTFTEKSTSGQLSVNGCFQCYTLELPVKDGLPGSAIPEGIFKVVVSFSPKFGVNIPHILDIPNRSDIEIHWGNTPENTHGCILVGATRSQDFVGQSRQAFIPLYQKIMRVPGNERIMLKVSSLQANNAVQAAVIGET